MDTKPEVQKWFLISEETIHEIKRAIIYAPQDTINEIVYLLNTEVHITDAVPDDLTEPEPKT